MNDQVALSEQREMVRSLAATLEREAPSLLVFETHLSWVLVAASVAYKIKKAVRFAFADLSTLALRHFYCDEELRLNTRLAPDLYLDVVPIYGPPEHAAFAGQGEAIEYAVKMRAFPQDALWSWRLQHGVLTGAEVDALAHRLADFHAHAVIAPAHGAWCTPTALEAIADETLTTLSCLVSAQTPKLDVAHLLAWEHAQRTLLADDILARKSSGYVRECHGDLHSANILTLGGQVGAFDCIDFNESLRWIDVMNDIAFACMDLRFRGRSELAARLLNAYLEMTGDYHGLTMFRYYETHRALIRCKVALLRATQGLPGTLETMAATQEAMNYLDFAKARSTLTTPALVLTHGFSGCGKSTVARHLVETLDAVQLRSDVERKRMHGIPPGTRADAPLYSPEVTQRTYARLQALAAQVMRAGLTAIVDATFLRIAQRRLFLDMAKALGVPILILDIKASESVMRARITARQQSANDVSDAGIDILERQLREHEPFTSEELPYVFSIDSESGTGLEAVPGRLKGQRY